MDPVGLEPQDELLSKNDKHYALHGEILLLVFVLAFVIFLALIILLPWLRRGRNPARRVHEEPSFQPSPAMDPVGMAEIEVLGRKLRFLFHRGAHYGGRGLIIMIVQQSRNCSPGGKSTINFPSISDFSFMFLYCRLRVYNAIYMCGTDEYGTAMETKAIEEKCSLKRFVTSSSWKPGLGSVKSLGLSYN
ncbi:hypothetical protein SLEP1_g51521 [Rubroshorea leprosula]|uniref:Methionyl/Leucyl tRNA synthetase domain-containing protein n=1 Tax=Rubroshorea leprosula TaxID=152421 RepID=A0AAV5M3G4_9ROSI|nr:hypothetical protein SLEP1_g51521 [Rubroshorea leprosula]